jgi:hypothetical protein
VFDYFHPSRNDFQLAPCVNKPVSLAMLRFVRGCIVSVGRLDDREICIEPLVAQIESMPNFDFVLEMLVAKRRVAKIGKVVLQLGECFVFQLGD